MINKLSFDPSQFDFFCGELRKLDKGYITLENDNPTIFYSAGSSLSIEARTLKVLTRTFKTHVTPASCAMIENTFSYLVDYCKSRGEFQTSERLKRSLESILNFCEFKTTLESQDPKKQFDLGMKYLISNPSKAFQLFKLVGQSEDAELLLKLAYLYLEPPLGDIEQGMSYLTRAADASLADAQNELAFRYFHGEGVERNLGTCLRLLNRAAEQNQSHALVALGRFYEDGLIEESNYAIVRDMGQAEQYYRRAAMQNCVEGQVHLADFLINKKGTIQDISEAVYYYQQAALKGNHDAQFECAMCLMDGHGVTQNVREALELLHFYAQQNNAQALTYLGSEIYLNGFTHKDIVVIPKDEAKARSFLKLAVRLGDEEAFEILSNL